MIYSVEWLELAFSIIPHLRLLLRLTVEGGLIGPIFAFRGRLVVFCRRSVSGVHPGTGVKRLRGAGKEKERKKKSKDPLKS